MTGVTGGVLVSASAFAEPSSYTNVQQGTAVLADSYTRTIRTSSGLGTYSTKASSSALSKTVLLAILLETCRRGAENGEQLDRRWSPRRAALVASAAIALRRGQAGALNAALLQGLGGVGAAAMLLGKGGLLAGGGVPLGWLRQRARALSSHWRRGAAESVAGSALVHPVLRGGADSNESAFAPSATSPALHGRSAAISSVSLSHGTWGSSEAGRAAERSAPRRRLPLPPLGFSRVRRVPFLARRARLPLSVAPREKKRILILISDTGGGHRASAQALAGVLEERYGESIETVIVDVWTTYGPWPYNRMVPQYRYMASRPALWYTAYKTSSFAPTRFLLNRMMSVSSFRGVRECIYEYAPDLVVSMHPLCQTVPLQVLRALSRGEPEAPLTKQGSTGFRGGSLAGAESEDASAVAAPRRHVPFATVVTDLGSPHPLWLHPGVDLCFVPSQVFVRAALQRGLRSTQLRRHGLPVRRDFTKQELSSAQAREALGLQPDPPTVLVVGGGDGVGKLEAIVEAIGSALGKRSGASQMVVVCGKNARLRQRLKEVQWPRNVNVVVEGFVTRMSVYMSAADCIVTKAGPGTIAEASICGLPVMLSGHLPGQESGNVKYVLQHGFGAYSRKPRTIARTVNRWLSQPDLLAAMSVRARRAARPEAACNIVDDLVGLLARYDGCNPFGVEVAAAAAAGVKSRAAQAAETKAGAVAAAMAAETMAATVAMVAVAEEADEPARATTAAKATSKKAAAAVAAAAVSVSANAPAMLA